MAIFIRQNSLVIFTTSHLTEEEEEDVESNMEVKKILKSK
jgi:hypothetical protein